MPVSAWRPSRLTRSQQEERRLAAQAVLNDPQQTTRDLAEQFGVREVTIRAWRSKLRNKGESALRASRATGRPEQLTPEQQLEIQDIIGDNPQHHGFDSSGWTIPRIRQVIGLKFGVWLNRAHLSRKLRRWGFSYQRPVLRALERHEENIATWIRVQGEALEKKDLPRCHAGLS